MNTRHRIFLILLTMLLLCLPLVSFAEETDTQIVPIINTPIKGQILLEKTGLQKTSAYLGEPTYAQGYLKDAVLRFTRLRISLAGKERGGIKPGNWPRQ